MRSASLALLLSILPISALLASQTENRAAEGNAQGPELSLILEPGPIIDGVPASFVFHLTNVGERALRLPEPNVDCSNATIHGSVWLNESWQPPTGAGLGKGVGICDFGSSGLPSPPITETAKKWHMLKPGESFYVRATQAELHFDATKPGAYTFSAIYLPPSLDGSQIRALDDAGIAVQHRKAMSASLRYEKR